MDERQPMPRRYAVLWCEDGPTWEGRESIITEAFVEDRDRDTFDYFKVPEGKLPDLSTINQYTGIIISGSRWSAYDDLTWIHQLKEWLRQYKAATNNSSVPRMAGLCFGAQVIAEALGGKVGPNETSPGKFVFGTEKLSLNDSFDKKNYVKAALAEVGKKDSPSELTVLESHGDAVNQLPPDAELLASSATTRHEMYTINDHIFAIQGHPEFTVDILGEILPRIRGKRLNEQEEAEAIKSLERPPDSAFLRKVIRRFLDRDQDVKEN